MKFNVTYWLPQQFAAVAEEGDVHAALQNLVDGHYAVSVKQQARVALAELAAGREPNLEVVAYALEEDGFEGERSEPESIGEATDFTVEVRES